MSRSAPRGPAGDLLAAITEIAERAGAVILEHYAQGAAVEVRAKADASPVTAADEAAEDVILEALAALTPEIPVVSEEAAAAGHVPDVSGGTFWLVDPLDGTKEFLSRNGEFTVNIALVEQGVPVAGVVHAPARALTWTGAKPLDESAPATAGVAETGGPGRDICARPLPAGGAVVVASRRHGSGEIFDAFLADYIVTKRITAGSSLKFCLVADGTADLYPRFGRTMEWDTAAGHAVLRAAGGKVLTADGVPLTYAKPGFENPFFIAYGRG
ncbi:MAG: 3'(2'),5'-bisphosphate nucleotidase CysQ [Rhodospirillales bacterium]|nr:3'(2'),5'-bisphosphate nucleotidase CysQ [Rhodospirillales bacterium]